MEKIRIMLHFINTEDDKFILRTQSCYIPRKNDEVRINNKIYNVDIVVSCFDEETAYDGRVNIGLSLIK